MTIYFGFSDESGDYRLFKTGGFLRAHPYYIRATLYFEADSWRALEASVQAHRAQLQLPSGEIKWSYLWSLEKHKQKKEPIPKDRPYYFLRDIRAVGFGARQVPRGKDYESRLAELLNEHEREAAA